jgi:hypothetical protein
MSTVAAAIQYLDDAAAHAKRMAEFYAASGRMGSDDAESAAVPMAEHAQHLAALAQAVKDLDAAARAVFTAKGRHHTQIATCNLGDLLGIKTVRP